MKTLSVIGAVLLATTTTAFAHHINKTGHYQPIGNEARQEGHWNAWNKDIPINDWSFNIVDTVSSKGKLSQRFELRNGDCTVRPQPNHDINWGCYTHRERAEVVGKRFHPGSDQWWGFSVMINDEWKTSEKNHCTSIWQIKQAEKVNQSEQPQAKSGSYFGGHYIGSHSVVAGYVCGEKVGLKFWKTGWDEGESKFTGWVRNLFIPIADLNDIRGKWNDIVIHWDTTNYKNEYSNLEIFVNGYKVGNWENITTKFFPEDYFFKYGPYRSYMKQHGVTSDTQVIYFDEMRFGDSYEEVTPKNKKAID
ncbi:MAG: heparin lyase I family protein [Bacteroidia bacterium]